MVYEQLKDKVVMITGASEGLGRELAKVFAAQDCVVYVSARRFDRLENLAEELRAQGKNAIPIQLDVADQTQVESAAQKMVQDSGRIDVWVNNAGVDKYISVLDLTPKELYDITEVNYFGLVYGTVAAGKQMVKQQQGDIVQILSTSACTPRKNEAPYCAAKAAALMFSEVAAQELLQHNIRVLYEQPGGMNTSFFEKTGGLTKPQNAMNPADIAQDIMQAVALPRNIARISKYYRFS